MPKQSTKTVVAETVAVNDDTSSVEDVNVEDCEEINKYVSPSDFNISKFYLRPIEEKMSKGSQYLAFPKYRYSKNTKEDDVLIITTDPIKLTKGGIPRLDGEYKKTDGDRMFFWLGCDETQKSCTDLFQALTQIDEAFSEQLSKNAETKVLHILKEGKKEALDKLDYVPLVRESVVAENAEKKTEPFNRIKVAFNKVYDKDLPEGQVSDITTVLFFLDREEPEQLRTVTDFDKFLRWNCEARFVLQISKLWTMKAVKNKKRECGFGVKCLQIYITKEAPTSGVSTTDRFKKRLFVNAPAPQPVQQKQVEKVESEASSESDEDSDEETSEEQPVQTTKQTKQATPAKQESEEEDSEEEDDSEEEEEESPAPPPPKQTKTSQKKKQQSSDDESSEEKPKGKGGKVAKK